MHLCACVCVGREAIVIKYLWDGGGKLQQSLSGINTAHLPFAAAAAARRSSIITCVCVPTLESSADREKERNWRGDDDVWHVGDSHR